MPIFVYAIALLIAAGTLVLSVDLATKPDIEPEKAQVAASAPVRQIPLGKTSDVSPGDPQNQLTPVYPTAPKDAQAAAETAAASSQAAQPQDMPEQPAATAAVATPPATAPAVSASTTGVSSSDTKIDQPRIDVAATAPNSCAVDACSSAYRSFRASDCTYQPYGAPRRVCELTAVLPRDAAPRSRMTSSRAGDLDAAARVVRQIPAPDEFEDARGRRMIVIERQPARYAPRVIYEEW